MDSQVGTLTPTLVMRNSADLDEEPLRYVFQLFADAGLQIPVTASSALPAGDNGATAWTVNTALQENAWYYWQYAFEVYDSADLTALLAQRSRATPTWVVEPALADNHWRYWRARATDEHGVSGLWTPAQRFFVNDDGVDDPPTLTLLQPTTETLVTEPTVSLAWDDADPDSNARISLYYDTTITTTFAVVVRPDSNARISLYYDADATATGGALIVADLPEDSDGADDRYAWDVSRLPPGRYFVYGMIDDGHGAAASYAPEVIVIAPIAQGAVKITRTSQPDTTEGGVSSTFTLAFDRAPTADVTLALQSDHNRPGGAPVGRRRGPGR